MLTIFSLILCFIIPIIGIPMLLIVGSIGGIKLSIKTFGLDAESKQQSKDMKEYNDARVITHRGVVVEKENGSHVTVEYTNGEREILDNRSGKYNTLVINDNVEVVRRGKFLEDIKRVVKPVKREVNHEQIEFETSKREESYETGIDEEGRHYKINPYNGVRIYE